MRREALTALELAALEHTGSEISFIRAGERKMDPRIEALFIAERKAFEHWKKTFRHVRETYFALHGQTLHEFRDWEGRYGCDEEEYRFFYKPDGQQDTASLKVRKEIALAKFHKWLDARSTERKTMGGAQ